MVVYKYILMLLRILIAFLLFVPMLSVEARGLVPCGGSNEPDCQSCYAVALVNGVVIWLVGILGTIATIIIVYAGFKLVTSGGNVGAKQQAKSLMTNMAIGYAIVLSAWLIIDYGMKTMVNQGSFGVWNELQCVEQPVADWVSVGIIDGAIAVNECDVGPSGDRVLCASQTAACIARGGTPTTDTSNPRTYSVNCALGGTSGAVCDVGPSGARVLCTAQTAACTSRGGTPSTDTTNSAAYVVNCAMPLPGGVGGSCSVLTSGPCSVENLRPFFGARAEDASQICNKESGGAPIMSGSDICCGTDGSCSGDPSFSGGYFQINILSESDKIPGCNISSFFQRNGSDSAQGNCVKRSPPRPGAPNGICLGWSCSITPGAAYNTCRQGALNHTINLQVAKQLFDSRGFQPWKNSRNICGVSN